MDIDFEKSCEGCQNVMNDVFVRFLTCLGKTYRRIFRILTKYNPARRVCKKGLQSYLPIVRLLHSASLLNHPGQKVWIRSLVTSQTKPVQTD